MRCETCQGAGFADTCICGKFPGGRCIGNGPPGKWFVCDLEISRLSRGSGPCPDCGGSGISHCCDGLQEQRDPGDETSDWPDRLGEMERDVTGCADDCVHPSHNHDRMVAGLDEVCQGWQETALRMNPMEAALLRADKAAWLIIDEASIDWHANWRETLEKAREFNVLPDTHAEWRSLNESQDGKGG